MPPTDITVHLASDMPGWLTPGIAAGAAILAAFLTWLGTRINDASKVKREKRERWDDFIIEQAAILQRGGEAVHKAKARLKSREEVDGDLMEARNAYEQLTIVAPQPVVASAVRIYGLAVQHAPTNQYNPLRLLKRHREFCEEMNEAIRSHIGVGPLKWTPPDPQDVDVIRE